MVKTSVIYGKCDNTGNANKTPSTSPKLIAGKCLFLFHIRYYLKISLIYNKFLKWRRILALAKKPKC